MYVIKQLVGALVAFLVIALAVTQSTTDLSDTGFEIGNVTTRTEDYILENQRQFNATLQNYLDQMDIVTNGLEFGLKVIDRQKVLLLKLIQEQYEEVDPYALLGLPGKYCVQQYRQKLPYDEIVKRKFESCISNARSDASSLVSSANSDYTILRNYYIRAFNPRLNACAESNSNPSLNYTLCVANVISQANSFVHSSREHFAADLQSAYCSLNSRLDVAARCAYDQLSWALTSIGAASIDECLADYLGSLNENNNSAISAGCPNVVYVEVKDTDAQPETIKNPLLGLNSTTNCVEIRFV